MVCAVLRQPCSRIYESGRGPTCLRAFYCIIEEVMPATILLVEDNPLARRNMTLFFKTHGYEVLEAQRGEEALKLIRDVDNFDVVITDLRMPGMVDGLEVLRVQNEVSPGTKTILVTAYGSNQIKFQAAELGAVYLDKPVQLDDLLVHVRQLTSP
mgnify:FL=1